MTIFDEYERAARALEDVTGQTLDTAHPRRTEGEFWTRAIIAQHLRDHGWTDAQAAPLLNRDRTTLLHARLRLHDALRRPSMYADIVRLERQFKTRYNELFRPDL